MLNRTTRNDLEIKIKSHNNKDKITMSLTNRDTNFTEKIIALNINITKLQYKIYIDDLTDLKSAIKSMYLPSYTSILGNKIKFIDYHPNDFVINIEDFNPERVYQIKIELIEQVNYSEIVHKNSNVLLINTKHGMIDRSKLVNLHQYFYQHKKIMSKSEKDSINAINNEIEFQDLNEVLQSDDVKTFTLQNRNFEDMNEFMNSKMKVSKKMTSERVKKVLFSTQSKLFFDEKIRKNGIKQSENPFMKNEWFMGPVYSYDENYDKYFI